MMTDGAAPPLQRYAAESDQGKDNRQHGGLVKARRAETDRFFVDELENGDSRGRTECCRNGEIIDGTPGKPG